MLIAEELSPYMLTVTSQFSTASELIEQRHLGLSFKQIGRKLGIDPHKGDVHQVSL